MRWAGIHVLLVAAALSAVTCPTFRAFTPTVLDQVSTIALNSSPLVDYNYVGNTGLLLDTRTTTTSAGKTYLQDSGYDGHRRKNSLVNRVNAGGGYETVAAYAFTHDNNSNPLSQNVTTGLDDFLGDDRLYAVDRLNRLTDTAYLGSGELESTDLDLVGNRELHTDRAGEVHHYALANPANEYATIDDVAVHYDATGNLSRDEAGNGYNYDEHNRLARVFVDSNGNVDANGNAVLDGDETILGIWTYDALGRQISFHNAVADTTVRYYFDGQAVIEERDGACPGAGCESLVRYHVNGSQYIDERVATFDALGLRANEFTYYLLGDNYSVAGTGNADGSVIDRLDYGATGDLASTPGGLFFDADNDGDIDLTDWSRAGNGFAACLLGPGDFADEECLLNDFDRDGEVDLRDAALFQRFFSGAGTPGPLAASRNGNYAHDADGDLDVDIDDYAYSFAPCLDTPTDPRCVAVHDFDQQHAANGMVNFGDYQGFQACAGEPGEIPPDECFRPGPGGVKPTSGSFALHGAMVDVLDADGPAGPAAPLPLQKNRARYFDLKNGRWLQRDPKPYVDGPSLYEAFDGNALTKTDPSGRETYAEATRRHMRMDGAEVVAVDYWVIENGRGLGFGAQFYLAWNALFGSFPSSEIAERTFVGTEYYASTADPRLQFRIDTLIENQRWLVEEGYIANRDVANLREGLIVAGTTIVALPAAYVVGPAAVAATGTTTGGMVLGGAITGGSSLGTGSFFGHVLAGDSPRDIGKATVKGILVGAGWGGFFGGISRFDIHLTGPNAGQWVYGSPFAPASNAIFEDLAAGPTDLTIGPYGRLSQNPRIPGQAHHLNQAAAYGKIIPFRQGMAIKLEGNILTEAGTPHNMAHVYMEDEFWSLYRPAGMGIAPPSNLQYTMAMQESLRQVGLSEIQIQQAVQAAIRERVEFGLLGGQAVPNVPNEIRNLAR